MASGANHAAPRTSSDRPLPSTGRGSAIRCITASGREAERSATVADLAASRPLAVMHLIADPRPVLGSGVSEFVRGAAWFAPLAVAPSGGAA